MTASTSNVFCSPLSSEIFHLVFLVLFVLSQSSHIFEQDSATEIVNYVTDITSTHTGIWSKIGCGAFCLIDTNFSSCAVFGLDANFERCTCGRMYFVPPVTSGQVSNNLTFYVNAACKDETGNMNQQLGEWTTPHVKLIGLLLGGMLMVY